MNKIEELRLLFSGVDLEFEDLSGVFRVLSEISTLSLLFFDFNLKGYGFKKTTLKHYKNDLNTLNMESLNLNYEIWHPIE